MVWRLTSGWRRTATLAVALVTMALSGCAGGAHGREPEPAPRVIGVSGRASSEERVAPSRCPSVLPRCRSAEGRIVFVEAHDSDGDGDAHFVLVDLQGITLPGLTAVKVPRRLRPDPLPGLGDLISAAGQVQTGSHGEDEIHAREVHVARSAGR